MAGLFLLSDYPLVNVVWLVPALYALRSLLVLLALARRIALPASSVLRAAAGAAVLTGLVLLASLGVRALQFGLLLAGIAAAAVGLVVCLLTLRLTAPRLLAPELTQMLLARAAESALARRLCGLLGLKTGART